MKLRVLVVSNVRMVREGLSSILAQRGVDVVSTVDLPHAGDRCAQLHPDVTLFDAARQDSVEFVKDLVASAPHSRVVAFGVKETDEEILALAAAGRAGPWGATPESGGVVRWLRQAVCAGCGAARKSDTGRKLITTTRRIPRPPAAPAAMRATPAAPPGPAPANRRALPRAPRRPPRQQAPGGSSGPPARASAPARPRHRVADRVHARPRSPG